MFTRQDGVSQVKWALCSGYPGLMELHFKLVTVSDSTAAGARVDEAGPAMKAYLETSGHKVVDRRVVADGVDSVAVCLQELSADFTGVVLTLGGTGFGPRDLTPEATKAVIEREAPGLAEALRIASPRGLGRLNRSIAGTKESCLIVNLPGSTKGSQECLESVIDTFSHIVELLSGDQPH